MKIAIVGLWHLGVVYASGFAKLGHTVVGVDEEIEKVNKLRQGQAPIFEPELDALLRSGIEEEKLRFSTSWESIEGSEIVLIAYDTPIHESDIPDVGFVIERIHRTLPYLSDDGILLICSQLPVGSTRNVSDFYKKQFPLGRAKFAYWPENLRLGQALKTFMYPDRIVMGSSQDARPLISELLSPLDATIKWMSVESAEMTKHAVNAFLATSIVFANELASICERVGADMREVERGLRSDSRVGPQAYVKAGAAFSGGTLARDLAFLEELQSKVNSEQQGESGFFSAIQKSNRKHRQWIQNQLEPILGAASSGNGNLVIGMLGLTYKPNTGSLRRSSSLELAQWLQTRGCEVQAFDPFVSEIPDHVSWISVKSSALDVCRGASALIVSYSCEEFSEISESKLLDLMETPLVIDPAGALEDKLGQIREIQYRRFGRPHDRLE